MQHDQLWLGFQSAAFVCLLSQLLSIILFVRETSGAYITLYFRKSLLRKQPRRSLAFDRTLKNSSIDTLVHLFTLV